MCDYSLAHVASRPAQVADRLVTTSFPTTITRGFAASDDLNVAVCLKPGTEIAFDQEVAYDHPVTYATMRTTAKVARFRQIDTHEPYMHHDALEFPGGEIVRLTQLKQGQRATVLQLPAVPRTAEEEAAQKRLGIIA